MDGLPIVRRNGPMFCKSCGINYVRFILAFPLVGRYRLTVSKPVLKAPNVSALDTIT
jgi:hypothetical protein